MGKDDYQKLFKFQRNIYKQGDLHKILRVTSGTEYSGVIPGSDVTESINFGRKGNWILILNSPRNKTIIIDKQKIFLQEEFPIIIEYHFLV